MESKKRNQSHDVSKKLIDESIANAEERRKLALEAQLEETSLSDEQLEDVSGGQSVTTLGGLPIWPW